jgi:hypothetical protein
MSGFAICRQIFWVIWLGILCAANEFATNSSSSISSIATTTSSGATPANTSLSNDAFASLLASALAGSIGASTGASNDLGRPRAQLPPSAAKQPGFDGSMSVLGDALLGNFMGRGPRTFIASKESSH